MGDKRPIKNDNPRPDDSVDHKGWFRWLVYWLILMPLYMVEVAVMAIVIRIRGRRGG